VNSLQAAAEGKGFGRMIRRGGAIGGRYGLTQGKMDHAVDRFAGILETHDCGATFPLTAAALARGRWDINAYRARNIEFAVHGLYHVDHSRLPTGQQIEHLTRARSLFAERGITRPGFRCPYLRWDEHTLEAVRQAGFRYDSSQGLVWPVVNGRETETYRRVLGFYRALSAADYPALPYCEDGLLRIPYSLPDDEGLADRLGLTPDEMPPFWLAILAETWRLGELFVLGLHPERIDLCATALTAVLRAARALSPGVWIARLDEIAGWWAARAEATMSCEDDGAGRWRVRVTGPPGLTVLARSVTVSAAPWDGVYRRLTDTEFEIVTAVRPFIALTPRSSPRLASFLRQQGYIVEVSTEGATHGLALDQPDFATGDQRPLLRQIEEGDFPLLRFGRWPHGHRSALAVSGDIDALTLWDYGLRLFGR